MKFNKVKKTVLSFIIIFFMIILLGQNIIYATSQTLYAGLDSLRWLPIYNDGTGSYTYSSTGWGFKLHDIHPVYQILELDSVSSNSNVIGENSRFYCLNATVGDGWNGNGGTSVKVDYNTHSNLKDANEVNLNSNGNTIYDISQYEYYSSIIWLLDNLYIPNETNKDEFLKEIGIYRDEDAEVTSNGVEYIPYTYNGTEQFANDGNMYGYVYLDKENNIIDAILPDELIETVQQSAIWYFTNYLDNDKDANKFNCYTSGDSLISWLTYTEDGEKYDYLKDYNVKGIDGDSNDTVNIGKMYQEQASILYNYLVNKALKANEEGYTGEETIPTITIDCKTDAISKQADGKYKIGPVKIKTTGIVSDITLEVNNGQPIDCKIPSVIPTNTEFYIEDIPSTVEGNITIKVTAKGNGTNQILWTEQGSTEQPIVEINRETVDIDDSVKVIIPTEEPEILKFDLALRKTIIGVKDSENKVLPIVNEIGLDATRVITADHLTIPVTATYKHRKDPVVVGTGYKVKYQLNIYNEGDIDGYASIIVDQLPIGLKSVLAVGDTVTSSKGFLYEVKSYEDNKLVLGLVSGVSDTEPIVIKAYDGTNLDKDTISLECEVTQVEDKNKHYLTNIAYINEAYSVEKGVVTKQEQDRENTESKPSEYPNNSAMELNNTEVTYQGGGTTSIYADTNNAYYYQGQEDDDDFETVVVLPKEFDLKLVKYISAINGQKSNRVITVDSSKLNKTVNGIKITTADYNVSKLPITLKTGDYVTYTFRIYNEAEIDGFASEITEDIPQGLEFVYSTLTTDDAIDADINLSEKEKAAIKFNRNYGWRFKDETLKTISTRYLSNVSTENLIKAFDSTKDDGNGEGLSYKEISVMFKVTATDISRIIRNEAAITEDTDAKGEEILDRDSDTKKWNKEASEDYYDNIDYPKYKEDDEDYDNIRLLRFDISLRKFIIAVSDDATIDAGEYINTKVPQIDISKLKTGEDQTAIYNHSKDAVTVNAGDYVVYKIVVYNEGDIDGYASKITDYLPEYLNYIDGEYNKGYGWTYNPTDRSVTTIRLSSANGKDKMLKAFDGITLDSNEVQILCRVSSDAVTDKNITNIAEITEYQDENGIVMDIDSDSDPSNLNYPQNVHVYEGNRNGENASNTYYPGQEDDDDFDRIIVKKPDFDLALRKFITSINNDEVTTRIPQVTMKDQKLVYTHPKDVIKVAVGDTVTYTIRVYNEGKTDGYAEKITDDMPEYLEFLPKNAINVAYRWKMYDKDGKETEDITKAHNIVTDYTSKAYGEKKMLDGEDIIENPNLLNAFNSSKEISNTNPEYIDVKVAFKVKDPGSTEYIIKNKAQISEDTDKNGNPVIDIDSIPNEWNEGEDDQDYENISVEYFDLSLLKYVSEVEVTEKGKTTTTKTGNKGDQNDIIPKVEIHKKNLKSTVVKFIYTIKVTNEGQIPGYATEITDYVPDGLEFHTEDNKGWEEKKEGVIIATKLLSDTLLNPGESATVKVTFRWKNNENNLGVKTNVAEISEDDNQKGIPDRDSTPNNKVDGEDDIDEAEVLLSIKTGITYNIIAYFIGATIILMVLASGVILIKKFVL